MKTIGLAFAIPMLLALPAVSQTQVKVIMSGGFSAAFQALQPEFEKSTGITIAIGRGASQGNGPNAIGSQLRRGVPADVVILTREGLDDLITDNRIVGGTAVDLARAPLGLAVRAGAPKPDISTVEAFKQALLRARSVTFPASGTATYLTEKLFPQLGIAREMATKTTNVGVAAVARGDAEIALQPVSELVHAPGADFVGPIPKEVQFVSVFSAGLAAGAKDPEAGRRLIEFLSSESAVAAIRSSGMEPVKGR